MSSLFSGKVKWFASYLEDRGFFVLLDTYESEQTKITYGVPLESILGRLLFNIYILPLAQIIVLYTISYHTYAEYTQLFVVSPHDYSPMESFSQCIAQINKWMHQNFLQNSSSSKTVTKQK